MRKLLLLVVATCMSIVLSAANIRPTQLRCEKETSPLIDVEHPRFSWVNTCDKQSGKAAQSGYRIRVATSLSGLKSTPVWDSGKQSSAASLNIQYGGKRLRSQQDYWWQVQVWDSCGKASKWSEPSRFHTGLFSPKEWRGEWIGAPWQGEESCDVAGSTDVSPAPLLRTEFTITKPIKSVRFYGTGLGYFELWCNGKRVGDDYFAPNQTNYDVRPTLGAQKIAVTDPFNEYLVPYLSYDLTSQVREGTNAFGAILGNGFYNVVKYWPPLGYGTPRFMGQIEIVYRDGTRETVPTNCSWRAEKSAIVYDQIYLGEHYDARLEHQGWSEAGYDDSQWLPAVPRKAPCGKLVAQNGPADRIMTRYTPQSIERDSTGVIRVAFPEEISGWVELKNLNLTRGQRIDIKYVCESKMGANSYTASGSGDESYHARFTWFVFSKVEIRGLESLSAAQIEAQAVHSDVAVASRFHTSNPLLNQINKIWRRSQLDNMHGSVASDCPHRERAAYTGDGQAACVVVMHNFDAQSFYNKWIRDIRGAQKADGYVPNGAPWQPGCGGGPAWGAAIAIMPWEYYRHYGDEQLLRENYEPMKDYIEWMHRWVEPDGVMHSKDPQKYKNLGDWVAPRKNPPLEVVHTFFLWMCADIAARSAEVLGESADVERYQALAERTRKAFHLRFYDPATKSYGKHGCNVFALKMGMPEPFQGHALEALKSNIAEVGGHLDTGIFGTRYLFEVLCDNGEKELAYSIINKRTYPSFGHWLAQGATTTWEQWNGKNSRNHPMWGGGIVWFYTHLAGLKPIEAGYRTFEVAPVVPEGLESVEYSLDTVYGTIYVAWRVENGVLSLECGVPVGTKARIVLPDKTERVEVGHGKHNFSVKLQ